MYRFLSLFICLLFANGIYSQEIRLAKTDWMVFSETSLWCKNTKGYSFDNGYVVDGEGNYLRRTNNLVQYVQAYCDTVLIGTYEILSMAKCPEDRVQDDDYQLRLTYIRTSDGYRDVGDKRYSRTPSRFDNLFIEDARSYCLAGEKRPSNLGEINSIAQKAIYEAKEKLLAKDASGNIIPDTLTLHYRESVAPSLLSPKDVVGFSWTDYYGWKLLLNPDKTFSWGRIFTGTWDYSPEEKAFILYHKPKEVSSDNPKLIVRKEYLSFKTIGPGGYYLESTGNDIKGLYMRAFDELSNYDKSVDQLDGTWKIMLVAGRGRYVYDMKLKTTSGKVTGKITSVETPRDDFMGAKPRGVLIGVIPVNLGGNGICDNAVIDGTINRGIIDLQVTFTGGCCPGMRFKIEGKMMSDSVFFGNFIFQENGRQKNCRFDYDPQVSSLLRGPFVSPGCSAAGVKQ